VSVVSALIAKFCISASYAIIRLYTSELFENEKIKQSYINKCIIMARVGAICAPFVTGLVSLLSFSFHFLAGSFSMFYK